MKNEIDYKELTQVDINNFAKELVKFNTDMLNIICRAEELSNHPYISSFYEDDCDCQVFLERLAKVFIKKNKNNDDIINIESYHAYFQEIDSFMMDLSNTVYKIYK